MALDGFLVAVTQVRVAAHLQQRRPEILDVHNIVQVERFEEKVKGAAVEVVLITGPDPTDLGLRALAVEAVSLETASSIEYAEFPEQQTMGDLGRGYDLHRRYLELLKRLENYVSGGATTGPGGLAPRGQFPPAPPYPDPAIVQPSRPSW